MEELQEQLCHLENMTYQLNYISGLVYILQAALQMNEESLNPHYTMASIFISDLIDGFEKDLIILSKDICTSFHQLSGQTA